MRGRVVGRQGIEDAMNGEVDDVDVFAQSLCPFLGSVVPQTRVDRFGREEPADLADLKPATRITAAGWSDEV